MFTSLLSLITCALLDGAFSTILDDLDPSASREGAANAMLTYARSGQPAGNKLNQEFLDYAASREKKYTLYEADGEEQKVSGMTLLSQLNRAEDTEDVGYAPDWYWKAYASAALSTIGKHRKSQTAATASATDSSHDHDLSSSDSKESDKKETDSDCKQPSKCEPGKACVPGVCREAVTELCQKGGTESDACENVKKCYQRYGSALKDASNEQEKTWLRIEFEKLHHSLAEIHSNIDGKCSLEIKQSEAATTHLDKACFVVSAILRHHSKEEIEEKMKEHLCEELKHCYQAKSSDKLVAEELDVFRAKFILEKSGGFEEECQVKY